MLLTSLAVASLGAFAAMQTIELSKDVSPQWVLTFEDHFSGPSGQAPLVKNWKIETGGGGWGNNELQTYTNRPENLEIDGNSNLVIRAKREEFTGTDGNRMSFTSGRLTSQGRFSQKFGRFEARIKLPKGKGIWPAFWMLSNEISSFGWPRCGEIDIVENVGHEETSVHGTAHGPEYSGGAGIGRRFDAADGSPLSEDFHIFAVEWEPEEIRWYVDGTQYHVLRPDDIQTREWVFDTEFFVILNVAVGGDWPGSPDDSTVFPQVMLVDYVRVYRDLNLTVDLEAIEKRRIARAEKFQEWDRQNRFQGSPIFSIPGPVKIADFLPGEGVGYSDADANNKGSSYRLDEAVDIGMSIGADSNFSVGWTQPGEWLTYQVDVSMAGEFNIELECASDGRGGALHIDTTDQRDSAVLNIPDTGGWQNWKKVTGKIRLAAGRQILKLRMGQGGPDTGAVGNLSQLVFKPAQAYD